MKRLSIGSRLTLWYLTIFLLAELIFGVGMWFILRQNLYEIADQVLKDQTSDLERFLQARQNVSTPELEAEISEDYKIESSEDYLQISDADGDLIYRSRFLEDYPLPPVPVDPHGKPRYENRKLGHRRFRFISKRMLAGERVYVVQLGHPMHEEFETLDDFRRYLLLFAPILLLSASGVGYWLSHRALRPVDALARTARTISGHNLSSRLETLTTGDELQRLSDTLNEMLARIESAFLRITEFTADASHELRTPIALIHTEAELALRRSRNESEYREALQQILVEADRTAKLIEELLALARADSGREALNIQSIDLAALLKESASKWSQVASLRNLQFEDRLPGPRLPVMGDASALRRVIDILLDNAFKYTPMPGKVTLSAEERNGRVIVNVEDTGVGIAPGDRDRIFERFYRVDKARSRELGGAGLGLAIAQWIVHLHKGTITVNSEPGAGSVFQVDLPAIVLANLSVHAGKLNPSGEKRNPH
ncbi:MAG TPA: heavy metal sensor histidine kinase [Candidatus Sulfotelmatobacter sp.]|nr:heavy metal sensor histidine kinase [Candidatus Sulfotelmatobacter sp.]